MRASRSPPPSGGREEGGLAEEATYPPWFGGGFGGGGEPTLAAAVVTLDEYDDWLGEAELARMEPYPDDAGLTSDVLVLLADTLPPAAPCARAEVEGVAAGAVSAGGGVWLMTSEMEEAAEARISLVSGSQLLFFNLEPSWLMDEFSLRSLKKLPAKFMAYHPAW